MDILNCILWLWHLVGNSICETFLIAILVEKFNSLIGSSSLNYLFIYIILSVCSYDRIQPNTWSGAYKCWGKENREAPLRTACPPGIQVGLASNFEIKSDHLMGVQIHTWAWLL